MSDNKTAIVTGASQGIGAGLVEAFLKAGYNVVATSRDVPVIIQRLAPGQHKILIQLL
jgi:NAD(P)-dependent dehydrogenase (short-subunit alcohol dehydrogenase family)